MFRQTFNAHKNVTKLNHWWVINRRS